jgi:hypothetical protein
VTESNIEIIDARSGGRVVTIVEFLSRSNKTPGPGRDLYLQKQADARRARANLVEVDLLRAGSPTTLTPPHLVPPAYRTPYHASVWRASRPGRMEYWPAPLRERLPVVRVPLRPDDADVPLDLQSLVDECYRRGRYDDIDYAEQLEPSLPAPEAAWTGDLLRAKGLTQGGV